MCFFVLSFHGNAFLCFLGKICFVSQLPLSTLLQTVFVCCLCKFYFQAHQYEFQPQGSVQPFEYIMFTVNHVYCQGVEHSWLGHIWWMRVPQGIGGTMMHEGWLLIFVKRYKTPNIPRQVGGLVSLTRVLHNHPAWEIKNKVTPHPCPNLFRHSQRLSFWRLDTPEFFLFITSP